MFSIRPAISRKYHTHSRATSVFKSAMERSRIEGEAATEEDDEIMCHYLEDISFSFLRPFISSVAPNFVLYFFQ